MERYEVVKLSELIQELLDIQHNAGEDVEVVGSILDYGKEPTNRRAGVIFPQLVHHRVSLEQKCIISVNDCVSQNNPVEDAYYCFPDDIMGDNWEVGYAEQKSMSWSQLMEFMEEENV